MADAIRDDSELKISVDTGFKRVSICDLYGREIGVFLFNPADTGIISRYNEFVSRLDEIIKPIEDAQDGDDDAKAAGLENAAQLLYRACDDFFGGNMSEAFFNATNPFSLVNGKFYFENVVEALGAFIEKYYKTETKKLNARISKYTKSYSSKSTAK